jgi:hypothetical protein
MSKTIPEGTPVTIIKQLRLSPAQKLAIVSAANNGNRFNRGPEWSVQQTLQHLRLIEKRDRYTPAEKKAQQAKISVLWAELPALVRARNLEAADRKVDELRSLISNMNSKTYWLTDAAKEYLTKGQVTITL